MNAANCSPQLENILAINITQIGIDECVTANCTHSSGCSSKHEQSHVPTITTAGSVSLVSVTVLSSALCGCAARESPHLSCSSYQMNPCLNGGTCVDTDLGYRLVGLCPGAGRVLLLGVWGGGQEAWGGVIAWLLAVTDLTVGLHTGPANKPLIFR